MTNWITEAFNRAYKTKRIHMKNLIEPNLDKLNSLYDSKDLKTKTPLTKAEIQEFVTMTAKAFLLLQAIAAEFETDPESTQCFSLSKIVHPTIQIAKDVKRFQK